MVLAEQNIDETALRSATGTTGYAAKAVSKGPRERKGAASQMNKQYFRMERDAFMEFTIQTPPPAAKHNRHAGV